MIKSQLDYETTYIENCSIPTEVNMDKYGRESGNGFAKYYQKPGSHTALFEIYSS